MLIVPTINILKLQNKIGVLQLLKDLVTGNKNLQIRILTPLNKNSDQDRSDTDNVISLSNLSSHIQIRNIEEMDPALITTEESALSIIIIMDSVTRFQLIIL